MIKGAFDRSDVPLVYTRAPTNGPTVIANYNLLDRLAKVREVFFLAPIRLSGKQRPSVVAGRSGVRGERLSQPHKRRLRC